MKIMKWFRNVSDHRASILAEIAWERCGHEPITRWEEIREWWRCFFVHIRYDVGALICKRFGHKAETEEFVSAEYAEVPDDGLDHKPRITDIHGGGVDWFCSRCGTGGRSWF